MQRSSRRVNNCTIISTTLMVFKLLLCLSSPNFPSGFAVLFNDVKQSLKVEFVVYCIMTKMGANE